MVLIFKAISVILEILLCGLSLCSPDEKYVRGEGGGGVLLNRTKVSDVARLHLDFILCDDSLHRV